MPDQLPRYLPRKLLGQECLSTATDDPDDTVASFWSWAFSDLVSNTLRGVFAEWLVARALGLDVHLREEWTAHDLTFEGLAIEVKSSAYLQTWAQAKLSRPGFDVRPTHAWSAESGFGATCRRQADVYVFALLDERDPSRLDPLDVAQWRFFVLLTSVLDARVGQQKKVGLPALLRLGPTEATFATLRDVVVAARGT